MTDLNNKTKINEIKKNNIGLNHNNRVTNMIRSISRLITHERNQSCLLSKVCQILVESREYYNAWIARVNNNGLVESIYHAGYCDEFIKMEDSLHKGKFPGCAQKVFESGGIHVVVNSPVQCPDCPLANVHKELAVFTIRLEHEGRVYGCLSVSVPSLFSNDKEEQNLFTELSEDISYALWSIETEAQKKLTEIKYCAVLESTDDAVVVSDLDGTITYINPGAETLFGCSQAEAVGFKIARFCPEDRLAEQEEVLRKLSRFSTTRRFESERLTIDSRRIPVDISLSLLTDNGGEPFGVTAILRDMTAQKRAEEKMLTVNKRLQTLWDITSLSNADYKSVCDKALSTIVDITGSKYGFLGFLNDDETLMTIYSWSGDAMKDCSIADKPQEYKISECGIWAEAVRQRKPIMINNYKLHYSSKKGLPEGHVPINKFLSVPIFSQDKIVAVAAVANRIVDYTNVDADQIIMFMNNIQIILEKQSAENKLKKNEQRYKNYMENAPDGIFIIDASGKIQDTNEPACRMSGYSQEELLSMNLMDMISPDNTEQDLKAFQNINRKDTVQVEVKLLKKDRSEFISFINSVYLNSYQYLVFCSDITDRKMVDQILHNKDKEQRILLDNLWAGVVIHAPDARIIDCNKKAHEIFGLTYEQMIGKNVTDPVWRFLYDNGAQMPLEAYPVNIVLEKREELSNYVVGINLDSSDKIIWVIVNAYPVVSNDKKLCHVVVNFVDISEIKKAQDTLRENERLHRALIETAYDAIYLISEDGKIIRTNNTATKMLGRTFDDIESLTIDQVDPNYPVEAFLEFWDSKPYNEPHIFETTHIHKDGTQFPVEVAGSKFIIKDKIYYYGIARDITLRKRAEKVLIDSEEKFRLAFQNAPILMTISEIESGCYININETFISQTGYSRETTIGRTSTEIGFISLSDRDKLIKILKNKSMVSQMELELNHADGSKMICLYNGTIINVEGKQRLLSIATDITEKKNIERSLRNSELRYKIVADNTYDWETWISTDGDLVYCSPSVERITGYTASEIRDDSELIAMMVHPDDRAEVESHLREELLDKSTVFNIDYRIIAKDGTQRWVNHFCRPVFDDRNVFIGRRGSTRDITEQINAEEEKKKLQRHLLQAQKMEAIGTLAGGIAHDFNNILTALIGYTELASDSVKNEDYNVLEYLDTVLNAGNRAKELVNHILQFSRSTDTQQKPLEIRFIVKEVLKLLHATIPTSIEIVENISVDHEKVLADPTNIHQIIMNLCTNAYQSMQNDQGTLTVELEKITANEPIVCYHNQLPPDTYIRLHVGDTGTGITPGLIDKIFDPYFTTKSRGEGTGLGLAVTYGIITSLGGGIKVFSEVGKGTDFYIYIPVLSQVTEEKTDDFYILRGGNERILVVDDEVIFTDLTSIILASFGYEINTTNDSVKALELFTENPDNYDLVISDQTMPRMTGVELSKQIHAIRQDIPIILCTGFSEIINKKQKEELGVSHILLKPATKRDLVLTVRKVLDNG